MRIAEFRLFVCGLRFKGLELGREWLETIPFGGAERREVRTESCEC
jgi:hypothetical protein